MPGDGWLDNLYPGYSNACILICRLAKIRDSAALCEYLCWLEHEVCICMFDV